MKEDMKIIEQNIDYNSLIFGNGNADLSEKIRNALEHLLQAYKEDEAVIEEATTLLGELKLSKDVEGYEVMTKDDWKEYLKNKVKGEKE